MPVEKRTTPLIKFREKTPAGALTLRQSFRG
jgi:hypothetical protein